MVCKISGIKVAVLTLTSLYLELFGVGGLYKGLPKKPNNIDQPQEWQKGEAT